VRAILEGSFTVSVAALRAFGPHFALPLRYHPLRRSRPGWGAIETEWCTRACDYRARAVHWLGTEAVSAGHYQLVEWGCGTSCMTGAVIDAIVSFLVVGSLTAEATQQEAEETNSQFTGGKQYLSIIALITNRKDLSASLPLLIDNSSDLPAFDVSVVVIKLPSTTPQTVEEFNAMNPFLAPQINIGTVLPEYVSQKIPGVSVALGRYD